jgi:integrase
MTSQHGDVPRSRRRPIHRRKWPSGAPGWPGEAFAAHLPPVRLHDIRHAHISHLLANGVDARIISDRVGHSGTQMTWDYAAVAAEVSQEAAERAVAIISGLARR